jgi:hypothetical protein
MKAKLWAGLVAVAAMVVRRGPAWQADGQHAAVGNIVLLYVQIVEVDAGRPFRPKASDGAAPALVAHHVARGLPLS